MSTTFNAAFVPSVNAKFRPLGEAVLDQRLPRAGQTGSYFLPTGANTIAAIANPTLMVAISQGTSEATSLFLTEPTRIPVPSTVYMMTVPSNNSSSNNVTWRQANSTIASKAPEEASAKKAGNETSSLYTFTALPSSLISNLLVANIDTSASEELLHVTSSDRSGASHISSHIVCFPPAAIAVSSSSDQTTLMSLKAFEFKGTAEGKRKAAAADQPIAEWRSVYVAIKEASLDMPDAPKLVDLLSSSQYSWSIVEPTSDPSRGHNTSLFLVKPKAGNNRRKREAHEEDPLTVSIVFVSIDFSTLQAAIVGVCEYPQMGAQVAGGAPEYATAERVAASSKVHDVIMGLELFSAHLLPPVVNPRKVHSQANQQEDKAADAFDVSSDRDGSEDGEQARAEATPTTTLPSNAYTNSVLTIAIAGGRDALTYRPNDCIFVITADGALASLHLYGACPPIAPTEVLSESFLEQLEAAEGDEQEVMLQSQYRRRVNSKAKLAAVKGTSAEFTEEELAALEAAFKRSPYAGMNDVSFRMVVKPKEMPGNKSTMSALSFVGPQHRQPNTQAPGVTVPPSAAASDLKKLNLLDTSLSSSTVSAGEAANEVATPSAVQQQKVAKGSHHLRSQSPYTDGDPVHSRLAAAAETLRNIKIPTMPTLKRRPVASPKTEAERDSKSPRIKPTKGYPRTMSSHSPKRAHSQATSQANHSPCAECQCQRLFAVEVAASPPQTEMAFAPWLYKYDCSKRALLWISNTVTYRMDPLRSRPRWQALLVRGNKRLPCGPDLPLAVMSPVADLPLCAVSGAGRMHIIVHVDADNLSEPLVRNASELELRQLSTLYVVNSGDGPARRWRVVVWNNTSTPDNSSTSNALATYPSGKAKDGDATPALPTIANSARRGTTQSNSQQQQVADTQLRPRTAVLPAVGRTLDYTKGSDGAADGIVLQRLLQSRNARTRAEAAMHEKEARSPRSPPNSPPPPPRQKDIIRGKSSEKKKRAGPPEASSPDRDSAIQVLNALCADPHSYSLDLSGCPAPLAADDLFYVVHTVQRLKRIRSINIKGHTFGAMETRVLCEMVQQCPHLLSLEADSRTRFQPEDRHESIHTSLQQLLADRRSAKEGAAAEARVLKASRATQRERAAAMEREQRLHREAAQLEGVVVAAMDTIDDLYKKEALAVIELYATFHLKRTFLGDSAAITQAAELSNLQLHILQTAAQIVHEEADQWSRIMFSQSNKLSDLKIKQQRQEEALARHMQELERRERKRIEQVLRELGRQTYLKIDASERPVRRDIETQRDATYEAMLATYRLFLKTSRLMDSLNRLFTDCRLVVESTGRQAIDTETRQFKTRQKDAVEGRVKAIHDTAREFELLLGGPPTSHHIGSSTSTRQYNASVNSINGCPVGEGTGLWAEKKRFLEKATADVIHWLRIERTKARLTLAPVPPTVDLRHPCREMLAIEPSVFAQPIRLAEGFDIIPPLPRYMQPQYRPAVSFEAGEPSPDAWIRQKSTIHQLVITASLSEAQPLASSGTSAGTPPLALKAFAQSLEANEVLEGINIARSQFLEAVANPSNAVYSKRELAAPRMSAATAGGLPEFPVSVPLLMTDGSPTSSAGARILLASTGACVGSYTINPHTSQHTVLLATCTDETITAALNCFSLVSTCMAGTEAESNVGATADGTSKAASPTRETVCTISYEIKCLFLPPAEKGMGSQAIASFSSIGSMGDMGILIPVQSSLISQGALVVADVAHSTKLTIVPPLLQIPTATSFAKQPQQANQSLSLAPASTLDPSNLYKTIHYTEAQGPVQLWKGATYNAGSSAAIAQGVGRAYVTLQFSPSVDRLDCFSLGPSLQIEDRMLVGAEGDLWPASLLISESLQSPVGPAPPTNRGGGLQSVRSFRGQSGASSVAPPAPVGALRKVIVHKGEVIAVILEGGPLRYDGSPYWSQNIQNTRNKVNAPNTQQSTLQSPAPNLMTPAPPAAANLAPSQSGAQSARAGRQRGVTFVKGRTHSEPPAEPTEAEILAAHKAQLVQKRRNVASLQLQVQALAPTHPPVTVLQLLSKAPGEALQALMRGIYFTNDSWMLVEEERLLLIGVAFTTPMSLTSGQLAAQQLTAQMHQPTDTVPLPVLSFTGVRIVAEGKDNPTTVHLGFPSVLLREDSILSDSHAAALLKAHGLPRGRYAASTTIAEVDGTIRNDPSLSALLKRVQLQPPKAPSQLTCRIAPAPIIHDDDDNYFSGGFLTLAITEGFQLGSDRIEMGPPVGLDDDGLRLEDPCLYYNDELVACISRTVMPLKADAALGGASMLKRSVVATPKERAPREGLAIPMPGTTLRLDDIEPDARITFIFSSAVTSFTNSVDTNTEPADPSAAPVISLVDPALLQLPSQQLQRAPHGYPATMLGALLARMVLVVKPKPGQPNTLSHVHQRRRLIKVEFSHDDTKPARTQVIVTPSPPFLAIPIKDTEVLYKERSAAVPVLKDVMIAKQVAERVEGSFVAMEVARGFDIAQDSISLATSSGLQLLEVSLVDSPLTALLQAGLEPIPTTATAEVAKGMAVARLRVQAFLRALGETSDTMASLQEFESTSEVPLVSIAPNDAGVPSPSNNSLSVNNDESRSVKIKRRNSTLADPLSRSAHEGGLLNNGHLISAATAPKDFYVFFGEVAVQAGVSAGIARFYTNGKIVFYRSEIDKAKVLKALRAASLAGIMMGSTSSSKAAFSLSMSKGMSSSNISVPSAGKGTAHTPSRNRELAAFIRHVRFANKNTAVTQPHKFVTVTVSDGQGSTTTASVHVELQQSDSNIRIVLPSAIEALMATGDAAIVEDLTYRPDEDTSNPCCFLEGVFVEGIGSGKVDLSGCTVAVEAITGSDPTDVLRIASHEQQFTRYRRRKFEERLGKYYVDAEAHMEREMAIASAQTMAAMAAAQGGAKRRRARSILEPVSSYVSQAPATPPPEQAHPHLDDVANEEGWEEHSLHFGVSTSNDGVIEIGGRRVGKVATTSYPTRLEIMFDGAEATSATDIEVALSAVLFSTSLTNPQRFRPGRRQLDVHIHQKASHTTKARTAISACRPLIARVSASDDKALVYKVGSTPVYCMPSVAFNKDDSSTSVTGGTVAIAVARGNSICAEGVLRLNMRGFPFAADEEATGWGLSGLPALTTPSSPSPSRAGTVGSVATQPSRVDPTDFRFDLHSMQILYKNDFVALVELPTSEEPSMDGDDEAAPSVPQLRLSFDSSSRCTLAHIETMLRVLTYHVEPSSVSSSLSSGHCIRVAIELSYGEQPTILDATTAVLQLRRLLKTQFERPIHQLDQDLPTEVTMPKQLVQISIDAGPHLLLENATVSDPDTKLFVAPSHLDLSVEEANGMGEASIRKGNTNVKPSLLSSLVAPSEGELLSLQWLSQEATQVGVSMPIYASQIHGSATQPSEDATPIATITRSSLAAISISLIACTLPQLTTLIQSVVYSAHTPPSPFISIPPHGDLRLSCASSPVAGSHRVLRLGLKANTSPVTLASLDIMVKEPVLSLFDTGIGGPEPTPETVLQQLPRLGDGDGCTVSALGHHVTVGRGLFPSGCSAVVTIKGPQTSISAGMQSDSEFVVRPEKASLRKLLLLRGSLVATLESVESTPAAVKITLSIGAQPAEGTIDCVPDSTQGQSELVSAVLSRVMVTRIGTAPPEADLAYALVKLTLTDACSGKCHEYSTAVQY